MMFNYSLIPQAAFKSDLLVLFFPEENFKSVQFDSPFIKSSFSDVITYVFKNRDFTGKFKQASVLYPGANNQIKRLLLIGCGKIKEVDAEKVRELGFIIGKKQKDLSAKSVHIIPGNNLEGEENIVDAIGEGILYSQYQFNKFKTDNNDKNIKAVYNFLGSKPDIKKAYDRRFKKILAVNEGIVYARNLANLPSNYLTPLKLQKKVRNDFKNSKYIKIETLNKKELNSQKFRLLLSVAQGSKQEPCLLILRYSPAKTSGKKIVIVGKGVTFDSGGISIKPSANMDEMKFDMAGAAATIGIIKTAEILKPSTELIGVIPAVENMPGGNAIKPGDIIKAINGKTVEIINTDAEGRLILADALAYSVKRFKPQLIIDFATLTGSIVAALGDKMAGMFTNSDDIRAIFEQAGETSGDRVWPMPLLDSYAKLLESKYADLVNLGGRWAGSISAAKFLENFISENKWAHFDIAGTANDVKNIDYLPEGATGYGPRLFYNALPLLEEKL